LRRRRPTSGCSMSRVVLLHCLARSQSTSAKRS